MKKILCFLVVICCHLQIARAAIVDILDIVMKLDAPTMQIRGAGAEISIPFVGMLTTYNELQKIRLLKNIQGRIIQAGVGGWLKIKDIDVCNDPELIHSFVGALRLSVEPVSGNTDRECTFQTFSSSTVIQQIASREVNCDRTTIFPTDTIRITVKNARRGMTYSLYRDYPAGVVKTLVGEDRDLVFSGIFDQGGYYVTDEIGQEMKNHLSVSRYWPLNYRVYPESTTVQWVDKDGGIYHMILKMTNGPGFGDIQEMCRRYNDGEQNWNNRAMRLIPERQEYAEPGSWFYIRVAAGPNIGKIPVFNETGFKVANANWSGSFWEGRIGQNPGGTLKEWDISSITIPRNSIYLPRTQPLVNYELYNNGKLVDSKMQDDGGVIGFTGLGPGIYTVKAVYGEAELEDSQNRVCNFDLDLFIEQEPLITCSESSGGLNKNGGQKILLCVRDERIPYEAVAKAIDRFNAHGRGVKMELLSSTGTSCRIAVIWSPNLGQRGYMIDSGFIFNGSSKMKFFRAFGGSVLAYNISDSMDPGGTFGSVILNGSQYGISYELWKDGQYLRSTDGTAAPIRFDSLDINAVYTIRAVDPKSETSVWMNGSAVLVSDKEIGFTYGANVISTKNFLDAQTGYTDITYYNGLGYPYQSIQLHAGTHKRNVVTPILYDVMQRDNAKVLLPFVADSYTGKRVESPEADQAAYYAQLPAGKADNAPYVTNVFDRSGLSRIVRSYESGEIYRDRDKFTEFRYETNTAREVLAISYDYPSASISVTGNVPAGTLYKNTVIDADGGKLAKFMDGDGRVILERRNTNFGNVDTYYVYDFYFKRLCWVVSPEGSSQLSIGGTILWNSPMADASCYRYRYDAQGNLVERQLPGCGKESFVYDKGGRPVLSCDGNLASKGQWIYSVYDNHNNLIRQNLVSCSLSRSEIQAAYEERDNLLFSGADGIYASVPLKDVCSHAGLLVCNVYGNKEWVVKAVSGTIENTDTGLVMQKEELEIPAEMEFVGHPEFTAKQLSDPVDLKTYEKVLALDGAADSEANYVERYYFYDYKKRPIQISERGVDGGISRVYYSYDKQDNLLRTLEVCQISVGAMADSLKTVCEYDHRGRRIRETTTLNTGIPAVTEFAFDDFGRIVDMKSGVDELRTEQSYNLQGWLTGKTVRDAEGNDLFGMQLHYADPQMPQSTPSYTGNISEWISRNGADVDSNVYAFSYDNISRLTGAQHYVDGVLCDRNTEKGLTYDRNGNLLTLQRTENGSLKDSFRYIYAGNRLTTLWDGTASATFSYDTNGNMVCDGRKNIDMSYNRLNLLEKASRDGATLAEYTYLADGTELSAQNEASDGLLYRGSLVYRKQGDSVQLESAGFAGGRIRAYKTRLGMEFLPEYFVTDHLGSVRALYACASGGVVERNDYYPMGRRWTGGLLSGNRYRFSGKEEQSFVDLPYMNYGARMYDSELGRWTASDPLAEKYYPISPYAFCAGNPVSYVDPNGMEIWIYYQDDAGNGSKMLYTANMVYDGTNEFVSSIIGNLNAVYANGGNLMMDVLIGSGNNFNFTNEQPAIGSGSFRANEGGGGTIYAGNFGFVDFNNVEMTGHELFHGLQHELGQGNRSVYNEVEAGVFGYGVAENWAIDNGGGNSWTSAGTDSPQGVIYQDSFDRLLRNGYSKPIMIDAVKSFKRGSQLNIRGLYNNFPAISNSSVSSILDKYHPKIR